MISVIIPAKNEPYLNETIYDVLQKAYGDIEVIVILDGYVPKNPVPSVKNVRVKYFEESIGMRKAINYGVDIAKGKYIMKLDAHCALGPKFDHHLKRHCKYKTLIVPRRYELNIDKWDKKNQLFEFQYLTNVDDPDYKFKCADWPEYGMRVLNEKVSDLMVTQGSCYMVHRQRFLELGGLDDENYGAMGSEGIEICLKYWLSGGRVALDKRTWYAHWKRKQKERVYKKPNREMRKSKEYATDVWTNNKWPFQVRDLSWLIDKFKPVPGWHGKKALPVNREIRRMFSEQWLECSAHYPRIIKGLDRHGLCRIFTNLGYKVGCEIGVEDGKFSRMMMNDIPGLKLYLVDPYTDYSGMGLRRGGKHDRHKRNAQNRLEGMNVEFIEKKSLDALKHIKDRSLDFVYIDGNHYYNYVMVDIILWTQKVKKGGIVSGHDYWLSEKRGRMGYAPQEAVNDFIRFHKIGPVYLTDPNMRATRADRYCSWFWVNG